MTIKYFINLMIETENFMQMNLLASFVLARQLLFQLEDQEIDLLSWSVHGSIVVVLFKPFAGHLPFQKLLLVAVHLDPARQYKVNHFNTC